MSCSSSSQYVDDEAEHDSDGSNGEENVDKYKSDFIDDTVQEVYVYTHFLYIPSLYIMTGNLSNGRTHHRLWLSTQRIRMVTPRRILKNVLRRINVQLRRSLLGIPRLREFHASSQFILNCGTICQCHSDGHQEQIQNFDHAQRQTRVRFCRSDGGSFEYVRI
jgi:hypothetical protein